MGVYKHFEIVISGDADLLMHNGHLADPLNPVAKEMKKIAKIRAKSEEDYKRLADLEFMGGLYLDPQDADRIIVDGRVVEAALVEGARTTREGQQALGGMFVDKIVSFDYSGPQGAKARMEDPTCRHSSQVRVQRNKVTRTRPIFQDWTLTFTVSLLSSIAQESQLKQWIMNGGVLKGLGDWRPRYGRFNLQSIKEIKK